jgi:acylphosphatase
MKNDELQPGAGVEIIVRGRVQGVGYRYFTLQKAKQHGIRGSVSNLPDGDVRVRAIGENLGEFIAELRKGPSFARVLTVQIKDLDKALDYEDFVVE